MLLFSFFDIKLILQACASHSVMSDSLRPRGLYSPWNSLGQITGVSSLSLLQGIFPTQGLNPGLLNWRQILYQLNHKGSPRILDWVAYPFFSGSSWPRNQTGVSCIAGWIFTSWVTREPCRIGERIEELKNYVPRAKHTRLDRLPVMYSLLEK